MPKLNSCGRSRTAVFLAGLVLTLLAGRLNAGYVFKTVGTFNQTNGRTPQGAVTIGNDGFLYGVAEGGGTSDLGTLYKVNLATHAITALVNFTGPNGAYPYGNLVRDSSGTFYGTTESGGINNLGTVYKYNLATGTLTTLVSFNGANGVNPYSGLTLGADGNLNGVTAGGSGAAGHGTLFKLNPTNNVFTTLADFDGSNGDDASAAPILDASGNVYGTTRDGGPSNNGVVYKYTKSTNSLAAIGTFGSGADGKNLGSSVVFGSDGNLYGITQEGGAFNDGTIFKLDPTAGTITNLLSFNGSNGVDPLGALIFDAQGNLFGASEGALSNSSITAPSSNSTRSAAS